jgi:hypothetical protein
LFSIKEVGAIVFDQFGSDSCPFTFPAKTPAATIKEKRNKFFIYIDLKK